MSKFFKILGFSLFMLLAGSSLSWAQDSLKELSVKYNELRLDKGYSILYDNPNEGAKLHEFKIKFYKDETYIDETPVEVYPINGTIETYGLASPIIGFNRTELSVISLHLSGDISNFPSSAASIIALIQPTSMEPPEPETTNRPPIAYNVVVEVEASNEVITRSIADQFFDPDKDAVAIDAISETGPPLSYTLTNNGIISLSAPVITGSYNFNYNVSDSHGAATTAQVVVTVSLPKILVEAIRAEQSRLEALSDKLGQAKNDIILQSDSNQGLNDGLTSLAGEIDDTLQMAAGEAAVTTQLRDLKQEVDGALQAPNYESLLSQIDSYQAQVNALGQDLAAIDANSQNDGVDVTELTAALNVFSSNITPIRQEVDEVDISMATSAEQIKAWQLRHKTLRSDIPQGFDWRWPLGVLIAVGAVGVLLISQFKKPAKLAGKGSTGGIWPRLPRRPPHSMPDTPNIPESIGGQALPPRIEIGVNEGLIIMGGRANVATQAVVTDATPQAFFEDFKQSYNAIGRIGRPHGAEGQRSCGTGILITPYHVMTNAHVYEFLDGYGQSDEYGIEFMAEHENSASHHYEFSDDLPLVLEGFDIAIFTLRDPVQNRLPAVISPAKIQELEDMDIALIGYPSSENYDEGEHFSGFEFMPVMDIKRVSYGKIFRHSKDVIDPFGFRIDHHKARNTIIPHNASSIGGCSGSPLIDKERGQVLAVHFGGTADPDVVDKADPEVSEFEKANLAMPVAEILNVLPAEIRDLMTIGVTPITS